MTVRRQLLAALEQPFAVSLLEELRWRTRARIASDLGDVAACVDAYELFEPHAPWEGKFLLARFRCYEQARHALMEAAKRDVQRFLEGLDDIASTLRHVDASDAHEPIRPDWMPTSRS